MDNRGWSDIGYSFLVDQDGRIFEARGWGIAGGHTYGYNSTSHAFCVIINSENVIPSPAAQTSVSWLIAEAERKYGSQLVEGHRQAAATACPGSNLFSKIDSIVSVALRMNTEMTTKTLRVGSVGEEVKELQTLLNTFVEAGLEIDGYFGSSTDIATRQWQSKLGVTADGIWGPESHDAHNAFIKFLESIKPPVSEISDLPSGDRPVLKLNSTGPEVKKLQESLVYLGVTLVADGVFDTATEKVIKDYQTFFKIEGGADGVVGPNTWDLIDFLTAKKEQAEAAEATAKAREASLKALDEAHIAHKEAEAMKLEEERKKALEEAEAALRAADEIALEAIRIEAEEKAKADLLERDRLEQIQEELERIEKENAESIQDNEKPKGVLRKILEWILNRLRLR
jgi:peptidoglycan hydrolase-like protein with peptidoglycan-binding domain